MQKSTRKMAVRRETLCLIEAPEAAVVEGGIWPPLAPRTNFNCGATTSVGA